MIKNPVIKRLSFWFEKRCYKASSLIVSLSPGMQRYIIDKHKHPNVISVTNAANIELFSTPQVSIEIPSLNNRKYAVYTGNIGKVNNSAWLLDAALELKKINRQDVVILLVGDGQMKDLLMKKARDLGLDNFIIHHLIPKTQLVGLIQNAIASLVPLQGCPVLETSSPNKFFESLAAGVPVIQNTNGWMKDFLEEHKVGFTLGPDNPKALADLLVRIADDIEISPGIKTRARKIAAREFDKDILAEKMITKIAEI